MKLRWAGNVAHVGENSYGVEVKPKGKMPLV
jgi:hypothetical protein